MTAVLLSRHTSVGSFRLKAHRGGGGFSDVYEAVGPNGDRAAVKVLRASGPDSASISQRFRRERELLERIDSRRVARVIDADLECDSPWIASEYVDGPNLREAVVERGPLPEADGLALAGVLARTVLELHTRGIAHRDLSPNNVMIGPAGPVLIDFGSARMDLEGRLGSVLSVGTPFYAAPEALRGEPVGAPADIYAIARLVQFSISGSEIPDWTFASSTIPSRTLSVLNRCLDPDPLMRPSAGELVEILTEADVPITLMAVHYSPVLVRPLPRKLSIWTVAMAAAVTAVVVGSATYLLFGGVNEPVTVDSLLEGHPAMNLQQELEVTSTDKGWISQLPILESSTLRHVTPQELARETDFTTIEAYQINRYEGGVPNLAMIEISVEVLPNRLIEDMVSGVGNEDGSDIPMAQYPRANSLFQDLLEKRSDLAPWSCDIKETNHFKRKATPSGVSYLAVVITDPDCKDIYENDWTSFLSFEIFPEANAAIVTYARGHRDVINVRSLLTAIQGSPEGVVRDIPEADSATTSLIGLSHKQLIEPPLGYREHQMMPTVKRVWRLPAGRAMQLKVPNYDSQAADLSVLAYSDTEVFSEEADLDELLIPLGSLAEVPPGARYQFSNPTSNDWLLIFEILDTTDESTTSIDYEIGLLPPDTTVSELMSAEVFAAGASAVDEEWPSSGFAFRGTEENPKFMLPSSPFSKSSELDTPVDVEVIENVVLVPPPGWFKPYDTIDTGEETKSLHRNPLYDYYIAYLEIDEPHLEIFSEPIAATFSRLQGEAWIATDRYRNCLGSKAYSLNDGVVYLEFRVLLHCEVPSTFESADDPMLRFQRAPIIEFQLSTAFNGDGWSRQWPMGVLRGRFVPQYREDIQHWSKFVSSIQSQFENIAKTEMIRCELIFSGCSRS
jgi:serine/threonine protein kinase